MSRRSTALLSLILIAYAFIGAQYAALTPAWQVPDEPAHYNYIGYIAQHGALPELKAGDYDQEYLSRLTSERFPPSLSVDAVQYESWQPPLYYLLAAPVYLAFGGALLPLRLLSLLLGAGVVLFAYLAVRELSGKESLSLMAAGFIAFIPQHIAMMAGVNNDSLSELLIAIGLWLVIKVNGQPHGKLYPALAATLGLAFVTKANAYVLAPVSGVILLLIWRREGWREWKNSVRRALTVFVPAWAMGALWWGRNLLVYGIPDFMGAIRHEAVVVGQPRTAEWIEQFGAADFTRRFFQTTFQSFWGQFGWMGVVMDARVYALLLIFTVALIVAAAWGAWQWRRSISRVQLDGLVAFGVSGLLTLALYLYYNLSFVQHQGRYLFPALVPLSVAAAVALAVVGHILERVTRREVGWLAGVGSLAALAALDLIALYRFILPALA